MRSEEEIREMKATKRHEEPETVKGYFEGLENGWIQALNWMLEE